MASRACAAGAAAGHLRRDLRAVQQIRAVLLLPAGQQGPGLLRPVPGLPARALLLRPASAPPLRGSINRAGQCRRAAEAVQLWCAAGPPPRRRATPGLRSHTGVCWVQGRRTCSARSPSSLATASSGARRRSSSCAAGSTGRTRWRASGTSCPSRCGTCCTRSWPTTATAGAPPARTDTGRCPAHRCWLPQVWDPGAGQELCAAAVPVLLLQEEGRGQEGRRGCCQGGGGRGGRGHTGRRRPRRGRGACASSRPAGCC